MKVLKFGGTSVGSAKNINQIISIVKTNATSQVIVVSAFAKVTNLLIKAAQLAAIKKSAYIEVIQNIKQIHELIINELLHLDKAKKVNDVVAKQLEELNQVLHGISMISELSPKSEAIILSYGELLSSYVVTEAMKEQGVDATRKDSRALIRTNANFANASVDFDNTQLLVDAFFNENKAQVIVVPGFIAANIKGETTVLGRGGSDYSAAIIANALKAEVLEIWTDVSGMYTANPKLVKQAMPIDQISYEEAMELSHFGAKVIYPPTIHPVLHSQIPILIKNTSKPHERGTLISNNSKVNKNPIKGISHIDKVSLITLEGAGMVGIPGFSKRLFETLAFEKINVKLITQASSEHSICIGIDQSNADKAKTAIDDAFEFEIIKNKIKPLMVESNLAIIAIIGDQMKSHQGISGKMFGTLGNNNVNIRAIAQGASEKNISAVIAAKDVKKALNTLHETFFKNNYKRINLFITGVGNVGGKLIDQIIQQNEYLIKELQIDLRITGLSNSKKMIFDENGLDLVQWPSLLSDNASAVDAHVDGFLDAVCNLNLRNSIFIDITANEEVANIYPQYLRKSIGVVACNKIACSSTYESYKMLKDLSLKYNAPFLFETNVGAGLPIIDTLNNLIASGDKINEIHAVLSGSLNFIFNHFHEKVSFLDVVKQAGVEGYTEPDPRIDLSGVDVARKILILARESGLIINLEDIENESFLTDNNRKADSIADFHHSLAEDNAHFNGLLKSANSNKCQLKYVAELKEGRAKVGLREIPEGHPFYNLEGKDNIVMFYTQRYPEQPMIIKGAGAGAEVTASGLFADIIKIALR